MQMGSWKKGPPRAQLLRSSAVLQIEFHPAAVRSTSRFREKKSKSGHFFSAAYSDWTLEENPTVLDIPRKEDDRLSEN